MTENAVRYDATGALAQLQDLSDLGVRMAIDDFGTGQSSLAYLQKLPAHVVKIDKSFISHMDRSEQDQVLARAMISLSHELGYRVVAEGVEPAQTAALLRKMGCEEAQGYHFARPMEAKHFTHWLRSFALTRRPVPRH